jgi:ubiquinone/menaquinone biosynthesis C-methylase UbiE
VVALEVDGEVAERAKADAPANVEVVVGDGEHLPFDDFEFDVAATLRTLHHTQRPELLVAELTRVTKPGGTILVVDQLAPNEPLASIELTRFEHARDPSTTRLLADVDMRGLFDSNNLVLRRQEVMREPRDIEAYLDLAGCEGPQREHARNLAPRGYEAIVGWYVLSR